MEWDGFFLQVACLWSGERVADEVSAQPAVVFSAANRSGVFWRGVRGSFAPSFCWMGRWVRAACASVLRWLSQSWLSWLNVV